MVFGVDGLEERKIKSQLPDRMFTVQDFNRISKKDLKKICRSRYTYCAI